MPYDHSAFLVPNEQISRGLAGTSLPNGVSVSRFKRYLRWAAAEVQVAGTVATAVVIVRSGTTALATLTLGTAAALSSATSDFADVEVAAGAVLNWLHGLDATLVANVTLEFRYAPDNDLPAA